MTDHVATATTEISASPSQVWAALTEPDQISKYMFGTRVKTDWQPGSPITWNGEWEGKPYEDRGEILQFDPPKLLVHTHWSDISGKPDSSEHYQEVSWALAQRDGATELTITERNLPSEEGKAASEESWRTVLDNLKNMLET
jgi:uncharacterized protein YndB with AHSA1/START domain